MGKGQSPAAGSAKVDAAPKSEKKTPKAALAPDAAVKKSAVKAPAAKRDTEPAKKAKKSEIDDIFSAGKQKAQKASEGKRAADTAAEQEEAAAGATAKRPRVEGSKDDIFGETIGKGRKRTEEGFPIYTEDELGMAKKGGDTDLCPFDCDCCF